MSTPKGHSLTTQMDLDWCRELTAQHVVTTQSEAPKPSEDAVMIELSMFDAKAIVAACLNNDNPFGQAEAFAVRARWLEDIDLQLLRPAAGVHTMLTNLQLPGSE